MGERTEGWSLGGSRMGWELRREYVVGIRNVFQAVSTP